MDHHSEIMDDGTSIETTLELWASSLREVKKRMRPQPGLPMKKGRCGTMTHDYKRNGTTTLFAALNMLDGTVIANACPATGIASSSAFSRPSTNGRCPFSTCI